MLPGGFFVGRAAERRKTRDNRDDPVPPGAPDRAEGSPAFRFGGIGDTDSV